MESGLCNVLQQKVDSDSIAMIVFINSIYLSSGCMQFVVDPCCVACIDSFFNLSKAKYQLIS
jgi:hypothetical protein